jgi:hypothetical protein
MLSSQQMQCSSNCCWILACGVTRCICGYSSGTCGSKGIDGVVMHVCWLLLQVTRLMVPGTVEERILTLQVCRRTLQR